jgi:subtilase family serine protease
LLVEAETNNLTDLLSAVNYAAGYPGVVAVSMSWGSAEFSTEHSYDSYFSKSGVVFFASAGDNGAGVLWPSSSPNVVSVGGTTLNLGTTGAVISETAWSGGGGGVSAYEQQPAYQTTYGLKYAKRSIPDVSYDADPNTGVMVYDSTPYDSTTGWWTVGGTSAGAPQWAAIHALGLTTGNANFYLDTGQSYSLHFRDIKSGSNGYPATVGYDLATGLGSPITTGFKPLAKQDFSLSASASSLNIRSGSSGVSTITVSALKGFTGTVSLSSKASTGLTASLSHTSIMNSGTSTLKITIPRNIRSGTYPVTVTGISGSLIHSITVEVKVG